MVFLLFILSIKKTEKGLAWEWHLRVRGVKSKIKRNFRKYLRDISKYDNF